MKEETNTPKKVVYALAVGQTFNFSFTGAEQQFVVPANVPLVRIECYGAQGGTATTLGIGGSGGFAAGDYAVVPGETLFVYVGGLGGNGSINGAGGLGGFNGGGNGGPGFDNSASGGGGGGASDVRQGGNTLANRIIVAGGGGGGVGSVTSPISGFVGGVGGGLTGGNGNGDTLASTGKGGSQIAGGAGGTGGSNNGTSGLLGIGGNGSGNFFEGGPGGGGGLFGGGAGGAGTGADGSGGGGSAFLGIGSNTTTSSGVNIGNGRISITTMVVELTLSKVPDRINASPGETVNYTITVENSGQVTLTNIVIQDPALSFTTTVPVLAPTSIQSFMSAYVIPIGTPPGPFVNLATANAPQLSASVTATATVTIEAVPAISFVKSVSPAIAAPGAAVIFTLTAVNQGNVELVNVHVTDPFLSYDQIIGNLAVGASSSINLPFTVPANTPPGFSILNTAIISADNLAPRQVGVSLEVLAVPRLSITKSIIGSPVNTGEEFAIVLEVTNSGNVDLTNVMVSDDFGQISRSFALLPVGQSEVVNSTFSFPLSTIPGVYTNRAVAQSDQTSPTEAFADVTVIATPLLGLAKSANRSTAAPGQSVQFTIVLTNNGNVPLANLLVTDALLGLSVTVPSLAVGSSETLPFSFTVPVDSLIGTSIVNLVTAESPAIGIQQAEFVVTVVPAGLSISKQPQSSLVSPGETVNFILTVSNLLSEEQTNIELSDPLLGYNETIAILPVGASIVRNVPFTIPASTITNTVISNISQVLSDQTPVQRAAAELIVSPFPPSPAFLTVHKIPDRNSASPGQTIIYAIEISNTGESPATNVVVSDTPIGFTTVVPIIAPRSKLFLSVPFILPQNSRIGSVSSNIVTVVADNAPAPNEKLQAQSQIQVTEGTILVDLTNQVNTPMARPGETVLFDLKVTNRSNRTATRLFLVDSLTGFSTVIPELPAGESRSFQIPFTLSPRAVGETLYCSLATLSSADTPLVQAQACVRTLSLPDLVLTQTVNVSEAQPDQVVFFTITLRNSGNIGLFNIRLSAPLLGRQLWIGLLEVGAELTVRDPYTIPDVDEDAVVVSTASVTADNGPTKQVSTSVRVIVNEE